MTDMISPLAHMDRFAIDQIVEDLIGKILDGSISDTERAKYEDLVARRSKLLRTPYSAAHRHAVAS